MQLPKLQAQAGMWQGELGPGVASTGEGHPKVWQAGMGIQTAWFCSVLRLSSKPYLQKRPGHSLLQLLALGAAPPVPHITVQLRHAAAALENGWM